MPGREAELFARYAKALAAKEVADVAAELFSGLKDALFAEFCEGDEESWPLISAKLAVIASWQEMIDAARFDAAITRHRIDTAKGGIDE